MARFDVRFDTTNSTMTISHGDDWESGNAAVFKVVDPNGSIVHENTTIASPDLNDATSELVIQLSTDNDGDLLNGTYAISGSFDADDSETSKISIINVDAEYSFTPPAGRLNISYDCEEPELVLSDVTDYAATINGVSVSPSETSKTLTYKYPENIEGGSPADETTTGSTLTIGSLYTQLSQGFLEADLVYEYGEDNWFAYEIFAEVAGYTYVDVECDDCTCKMYDCINQLFTQWKNSIGVNPSDKAKLQDLIIKLLTLQSQYVEAKRCERDTTQICAEILATINLTGCTCCEDSDDSAYSTLVGSSSVAGSGSEIHNVATTPDASLGSDGDWVILNADDAPNSEGDLFYKEDGTWNFQFNLIGDAGADGTSSGAITDYSYSDLMTTSGLAEYSISNFIDGLNKINNKGDRVIVSGGFGVSGTPSDGSYIKIHDTYGVVSVGEIDIEETQNVDYDILFEIMIVAVSDYDDVADEVALSVSTNYWYLNGYDNMSFHDRQTGLSIGSDYSINISINITGGSTTITYGSYDVKFNKAV